ncbi:hypothetical protein ACJX0J_016532 [Zea mays]
MSVVLCSFPFISMKENTQFNIWHIIMRILSTKYLSDCHIDFFSNYDVPVNPYVFLLEFGHLLKNQIYFVFMFSSKQDLMGTPLIVDHFMYLFSFFSVFNLKFYNNCLSRFFSVTFVLYIDILKNSREWHGDR